MANSSCGAATTDRPAAATRTRPRQVRSARRARGGQGRTAGAAACWSTGRRGALARAEAAGRPPRRRGLGATSLPATAALAPARARPGRGCSAGRTRPGALARPAQPAAYSPRADDADTHRTRPRCSLPQPHARAVLELDREVHARTEAIALRLLELPGCGGVERRQAALRDRPDRPLPKRRTARPPRRRRTARRQLRQASTPSPRPRRQPPTQLRPAPHRHHPGPRARTARTYLERKQSEGKSRREAIRCLKRQLARTVYTTLKAESALT
jgi:hypothetical protein